MDLRVLVTGAGFAGVTFSSMMQRRGARVTTADRTDDARALDGLLAEHDVVLDFTDAPGEVASPEARTGVPAVAAMTEAVMRSTTIRRFLRVSSAEVYGPIEHGLCREDGVLDPRSVAAASKAAGDLVLRAMARNGSSVEAMIARPCDLFGPGQDPSARIPTFVRAVLGGEPVALPDEATAREWLHVEDACEALALLLERGQAGAIYNVGSGVERSDSALIREIVACLGVEADILVGSAGSSPAGRYAVDWSKVRALGWVPRRDFTEALAETVTAYQKEG